MADSTNQFLESQLDDARPRLVAHEKKLEEFRRQEFRRAAVAAADATCRSSRATQNQIQNLTESINRDRDRRLVLEKSIADAMADETPERAARRRRGRRPERDRRVAGDRSARTGAQRSARRWSCGSSPSIPTSSPRSGSIAELERKVAAGSAGASAPRRRGAGEAGERRGRLIRQARTRQFQTEIDKLDRRSRRRKRTWQRLRQLVSDYQRRVEAVPGHESELTDLMRDYETLQKIYTEPAGQEGRIADLGQPRTAAGQRAVQDPRSGAAAGEAVQPRPPADRADRRRVRADARRRARRACSSIATRRCAAKTISSGRSCCRCSPPFRS